MAEKRVVMSLSEILEKKQKLAKSQPIESKNAVKGLVDKSKVVKKSTKSNKITSILKVENKKQSIEKDVNLKTANMRLHKMAKAKEEVEKPLSNVITVDSSKIQSEPVKIPEVVKPTLSKYTRETDEQIFNKYIHQLNVISGQKRGDYLSLIHNMVGNTVYNELVSQKILADISSQPFSDIEKLKEYVNKANNNLLVISPFDASFATLLKTAQLDGRRVKVVEESQVVSDYIRELNIPNLSIINRFPLEYIESYEFITDIADVDLAYANFRYASPQEVLSLLNLIFAMNEFNKTSGKNILLSSLRNYGDKFNIRDLILSVPVHAALKMLIGENYEKTIPAKIYEKFYTMITRTRENISGSGFGNDAIFGGAFKGTKLNPNPDELTRFPDPEIRITSIPLTTEIIYSGEVYHKINTEDTVSMKTNIEEGQVNLKEVHLLAIYSDRSITSRIRKKKGNNKKESDNAESDNAESNKKESDNAESDNAESNKKESDNAESDNAESNKEDTIKKGSYMRGLGILLSYNQKSGLYSIRNADGTITQTGKNYFVLAIKNEHESGKNDMQTLDNSNIDFQPDIMPDIPFDVSNTADLPEMEPQPIEDEPNLTRTGMNDTTDSVVVHPRNMPTTTSRVLPVTEEGNVSTAIETTASAAPNANPAISVTPPSVNGDNSTVESLNSTNDNAGAADASASDMPISPIKAEDSASVKSEHEIINPLSFDWLTDSSIKTKSTASDNSSEMPELTTERTQPPSEETDFNSAELDDNEKQYLDNLVKLTNEKFKIASFKKLFETKRPNNPVLHTYLISL